MLEGVHMSMQHKQVPDPDWVIDDALAETVSLGVLKWISCSRAAELSIRSAPETEGFWNVEAVDALKGVARYVVTRLQRHGYEINRISA
jgi:hypothetical protein